MPARTPRARAPRRVLLLAAGLLAAAVVGLLAGRALPTTPGANSVDVGFARDMTTHHAQAVSMAYTALQRAPSDEVRQLAVDIASTQGNQTGRMEQLLLSWDQPLSSAGRPVMAWMAGTDLHERHESALAQGRTMPGMATAAEMARLNSESGEQFEVDFLQLMLRHHAGGLDMARYGAEHATTEQVRDLADAIARSQQAEAQLLTSHLSERGAAPLPAP
ncbi:DUF305 domain-containing protein [Kineococcus sp. TBRC 1896]|uniref:DUF305 domain-containing protein n=1 Tax=Kineococcus mangrovi TaxID=1660183 RepID=A0ABV4I4L0_9ACTN